MKRAIAILVGVSVLLGFHIPWAEAIHIVKAAIRAGEVVVWGNRASRLATITWEGQVVTRANRGGAFRFTTTDLPLDCVGELSDGVDTIDVVVDGCTTEQVVGGGVLKTGQTASFQAGDDGDLQLGAARNYTDNGDGTITDNATGLMWEKLTNDGSIHDWGNTYTWADAFQKIADLNTMNFAGHSDWRLPNINELQSLADYGRANPAIDPAFNDGVGSFTQSFFYWSSTTNAQRLLGIRSSFAWLVDFVFGGVESVVGKTEINCVRAVRGGS